MAGALAARLLSLLLIAASSSGVVAAAERLPVRIVQQGRTISAGNGPVTLEAAPFAILVPRDRGDVSVYATNRAGAAGSRAWPSGPVAAPRGMMAASAPLSLHVDEAEPEIYDGLEPALLERWGSVLGPDQIGAFDSLRTRLKRDPRVFMSGRQTLRSGNVHDWIMPVFSVGSKPPAEWSGSEFSVFVLSRDAPSSSAWMLLASEAISLRFSPAAGQGAWPSAPLPAPRLLDCGNSAVVAAVRGSNWQRVERLLRDGLDPNLRSPRGGVTLLMCALGGTDVSPETVAALLDAGADPNLAAQDGQTALHWAARGLGRASDPARLAALEQLIRRGGDVERESAQGETPLRLAVADDAAEAVALLLAAGADARIENRHGESALELAARLERTRLSWLRELFSGR